MITTVVIAGLTLGLLGSFHCVGMCGPLALALPVHHLSGAAKMLAISLYNIGRVITYSFIGLLLGLTSRAFYLAGLQQVLSIALGVVILLLSLYYFIYRKAAFRPRWLQPFFAIVQQLIGRLLRMRHTTGFLLIGMANGLLPCGMVYLAIAGAMSSTQVSHCVMFMAGFGTGTLPAMMALGVFGLKLTLAVRNNIKKITPYLGMIIAVLLILRGLNLGIPFISPILANRPAQAVSCH